jgi:uncharacterized protein (DUF1778 family)
MPKTVTVRLDEDTYQMIRSAAEGQMRSISNFIEYATLSYLAEEAFVSDDEMSDILADTDLLATLKRARSDLAGKQYKIVE